MCKQSVADLHWGCLANSCWNYCQRFCCVLSLQVVIVKDSFLLCVCNVRLVQVRVQCVGNALM